MICILAETPLKRWGEGHPIGLLRVGGHRKRGETSGDGGSLLKRNIGWDL